MNRDEGAKSVIALVEKLLSLQLTLNYENPRKAFSELMTNRVAAGYVFGFHDSCFQIFGLVNPNDRAAGSALFETSYKSIFGDQAGFMLFESSLRWQLFDGRTAITFDVATVSSLIVRRAQT